MLLVSLLWRGEIELPVTFWGACILLNFIVIERLGFLVVGRLEGTFVRRFYTALVIVLYGYTVPSVWRSARYWNGSRVWATLARATCVFLAVRVGWTFVARW